MAEDFYPFVDNGLGPDGTDDATQISPQGTARESAPSAVPPVAAHPGGPDLPLPPTPTRIAVYDDMLMPPRVVMVEPSDIRSYLSEITKTVYELAFQHCSEWSFQVIRELVENLIHASFMEPTISILDGGKTIIFSDHGPGIPNKQAALKPSFSSATAQMKRYIRGVGSGLPIVEEWLRMHHGNLTIEDNLGHGTSVTVSLLQKDEPSQTRNTDNGNVTVVDRPPTMGYPGMWANPFGSYFAPQQGYFSAYGTAQGSFAPGMAPGAPMQGYLQGGAPQDAPMQPGMADPFAPAGQQQGQPGYQRGYLQQSGYPQQGGYPAQTSQGYQAQGFQTAYPQGYPAAYPPAYQQADRGAQGVQQGYQPDYRQGGYRAQTPMGSPAAQTPQGYQPQAAGYRQGYGSLGGERNGYPEGYGSRAPGDQPGYGQPDSRPAPSGWDPRTGYQTVYGQRGYGSTEGTLTRQDEVRQAGSLYQRESRAADPYPSNAYSTAGHPTALFPGVSQHDPQASPDAGRPAAYASMQGAGETAVAAGRADAPHAAVEAPRTVAPTAGIPQQGSAAAQTSAPMPAADAGIDAHVPLTSDQRDIILLFAVNEKIGPKELNEQLGIPSASGSRKLKEIKEAGYIGKKGQKYVLTGEGQRVLAYLKTNEG